MSKKPKLIVQFNEANFDLIKNYLAEDQLPGLNSLCEFKTAFDTSSEIDYCNLEPWIQWYSFYTKQSFSEHKVFHLGDCLKNSHENFLERAAQSGEKVGVFGSINCRPSKLFEIYIPDPWTEAKSDASFSSRMVSAGMKKIVNANARLSVSIGSWLGLLLLIGIPKRKEDVSMLLKAIKAFFYKSRSELAPIFDYFLSRYVTKRTRNSGLDTSIFFMNGLAHIQHHYMLSSKYVEGSNPPWYVAANSDPLHNALKIYDKLFKVLISECASDYEIWIVTGLTQCPYPKPFYYWRIRDPQKLFGKYLNMNYSVFPRMTRDIELKFQSESELEAAEDFFVHACVRIGGLKTPAFGGIERTGKLTVFVSLIFSGEIANAVLFYGGNSTPLEQELDFVAIKNGGHIAKGWVFSNSVLSEQNSCQPIWEVPSLIYQNKNSNFNQ